MVDQATNVKVNYYSKNKAASWTCSVCGSTVHKSNVHRHNRSMKHQLALLQAEKAQSVA